MDELFVEMDKEGNKQIEQEEFSRTFALKDTARHLRSLDIDVEGLATVSDFIFHQRGGSISRKEFLHMVLDVRSNKKATVKDHIETRRFVEAKLLQSLGGKTKIEA